MKKYLLFYLLLVLLISCQKENNNPVNVDNGKNPYLNGNSEPQNSYFPSSKGTWWKYTGILKGTPITENITVSSEKQIDGVYYATLTGDINGTQSESFLRVQDNEYYNIGFFSDFGVKKEFELCLLKADKPIGEKWISGLLIKDGNINRYNFEIISKNINCQVKNKSFSDVIVVRVIGEVKVPYISEELWLKFGVFDYYFAKSIGLIKADYGNFGLLELADYSIK